MEGALSTLVNTVWQGDISNYTGMHKAATVKFNADGAGVMTVPGGLTFNYTQTLNDGKVTQFHATATSQDFIQSGVGFLANGKLTGTFNIKGVITGFNLTQTT